MQNEGQAAALMGSRKGESQSSPSVMRTGELEKGLDFQVMTRGLKTVVDGNSVSHCRVDSLWILILGITNHLLTVLIYLQKRALKS